jgi:hypothetical protein
MTTTATEILTKTDLTIETLPGSGMVSVSYHVDIDGKSKKLALELTPDQCLELADRLLVIAGEAW